MDFPVSGTCQCGQVKITLLKPPQKVVACHCKECQKLSSSPYSVTALFGKPDLKIEGQLSTWNRVADSGSDNTAKFCPSCGNRVYHFNPSQPELIKLKLKPVGIQDTSIFKPQAHVWTKEKQAWFVLPDDVPSYSEMPA
ncbi:GFA family protein [Shewanella sp. 202IG2-18]|uniref:GFA family protein n=1 Tax=Parashewanella hymeniacidonis TaxID=2807618 RepID=UPI001960B52E|nr:GFA family protein [Parashewanella hymeniacidonis]MBM7071336.1 GFA family protein [Parashewanella hymeniacidonis]